MYIATPDQLLSQFISVNVLAVLMEQGHLPIPQ